MRKVVAAAVFLLNVSYAFPATINYNGKEYWINGVNIPWRWYGIDAGAHPTWGAGYNSAWFEDFFTQCQSHGINCARLWIHCDGRASPEFDASGNVTGLDATFLSDIADICLRAENHGIMMLLCLWSFDMTNDQTGSAGPYAGMHADLIQNTSKTQSYIDNALIPLVQYLADTPNLFAWEIINEPEWSITGTGSTTQLVQKSEMQRFCAMIAEAVHENSSKMVTVGSACLKWNSDKIPPAEGNFWSDSQLAAAYSSSTGYLDFYQIHYYDWMYNVDWGYDPFQLTKPTTFWNLDKPTLVGECPIKNDGVYTVSAMIANAYANGYVGVMPWAYNSDGPWDDAVGPLKAFRDAHPEIVDYDETPDNTPPTIIVNEAVIAGAASDDGIDLVVTVNGTEVPLSLGSFTSNVSIPFSPYTIMIVARDVSDNTTIVNVQLSM